MIEFGSQRDLFEVPADVAYFNTANMSPLLRGVREAGEAGLARRARPWLVTSADWFEDVERLRQAYAAILGGDADGVALVPATSYGIAIAARNLSATPGDTVVVLAHEFPSNYYTWSRFCGQTGAELVVVERERGATWTEAVLSQISDRTRVLAVPNVHWTDGALDVSRLRPDYVVSVGYKWLLGPLGVGCLYVDARHREGEPLEENWINRLGSDDFASLVDYIEDYQPGARRFDVGERTSFGLVPMAIAAADQLLDWTIAEVAAGLQVATDQIAQQAEALGLSTSAPTGRGPHMLGIELPRDAASAIAGALSDAGVVASVRGNALRIAPHLHTTRDDLDRLANVLAAAVR
jgi:selenocysteine lyase/cysteine desulfurase